MSRAPSLMHLRITLDNAHVAHDPGSGDGSLFPFHDPMYSLPLAIPQWH